MSFCNQRTQVQFISAGRVAEAAKLPADDRQPAAASEGFNRRAGRREKEGPNRSAKARRRRVR